MYYRKAHKDKKTNKWLYCETYREPGATKSRYPIGYCADHSNDGHDTKLDAEKCWHNYLVDLYTINSFPSLKDCLICKEIYSIKRVAERAISFAGYVFPICAEHMTKEYVSKHIILFCPNIIELSYLSRSPQAIK